MKFRPYEGAIGRAVVWLAGTFLLFRMEWDFLTLFSKGVIHSLLMIPIGTFTLPTDWTGQFVGALYVIVLAQPCYNRLVTFGNFLFRILAEVQRFLAQYRIVKVDGYRIRKCRIKED